MPPQTKACRACGKEKPRDEFYKHRRKCIPCYLTTMKRTKDDWAQAAKQISEREFTNAVIELAHDCRWLAAHFKAAVMPSGRWATPVQGDGKGFPDLILVKEPFDTTVLPEKIEAARKIVKVADNSYAFARQQPDMSNIIAVELKKEDGDISDAQLRWLLAFSSVGIPTYIWTPADMPMIEHRLRTGTDPILQLGKPKKKPKAEWTPPTCKRATYKYKHQYDSHD